MTAREIADIFEEIAPLDSGVPGDQLGFQWGNADDQVTGVGCVWCAHSDSIRRCVQRGLNLIICHERLWMHAQDSPWYDGPDELHILPNRQRRELLERHRMIVYRSHSNWDGLVNDGIADQALAALGLSGLQQVSRQKYFSVQELPAPLSARELQCAAEAGLGYTGSRLFGDPEQRIRRFAFLIGGFGENQYHIPQVAMEMGAEAVILGEMSEFIVIACREMGLPVIETLHSVSEIPGIKRQAEVLAARLPGLRVEYIPSGALSFGQP
ncbi:MAG: Nif3-like dinuclear metal center hexameric protein [Armatimonadota bacterium]